MKSYVNMNAEKRAETTNKFDADFYKLSVNSLFSKMIENPKKLHETEALSHQE